MTTERRRFFRVAIAARIGLRGLDEIEAERLRRTLRCRWSPDLGLGAGLDAGPGRGELRDLCQVLGRIAAALERLEQRTEALERRLAGEPGRLAWSDPAPVILSASGLCGAFPVPVRAGELVEVQLDLLGTGEPLIPALARVVRAEADGSGSVGALNFDELSPEDVERIASLAVRSQSHALRAERAGVC